MPQYMLLIYAPTDRPPSGERLPRWQEYHDSLAADGALLGSGRLEGLHAATSVRVQSSETLITDGPFAETKEFLGGYFLVECPDLDTALRYAAQMPMEDYGTVEVRPMMYPANTPASEMQYQEQAQA